MNVVSITFTAGKSNVLNPDGVPVSHDPKQIPTKVRKAALLDALAEVLLEELAAEADQFNTAERVNQNPDELVDYQDVTAGALLENREEMFRSGETDCFYIMEELLGIAATKLEHAGGDWWGYVPEPFGTPPAEAVDETEDPPIAAGVVCNCPSTFCPAHGRLDKSEWAKGRKVRHEGSD